MNLDATLEEAQACLRHGALQDAVGLARNAVDLAPENSFARLIFGVALSRLKRPKEALVHFQMAANLNPRDARARYNLALCHTKNGNESLAMVEYQACLSIDPEFRDALWNYGEMLRVREYFQRALQCFDRLFHLEGTLRGKAMHRMAVCCAQLGLAERADALFKRQIEVDSHAITQWEYARFLLQHGRLDEAWPHYAKRFDARVKATADYPAYRLPPWDGQFMQDTVLLVHGEQGAGDEIFFASYLRSLIESAKESGMRVAIACRSSLVRLFSDNFPGVTVFGRDDPNPGVTEQLALLMDDGKTRQIAMGDLPLWIRKHDPVAYLQPNQRYTEFIRSRLDLDAKTGLKVGLVWAANPASSDLHSLQRNVDPRVINELLRVFQQQHPEVHFYSLQNAEHRSSLCHFVDCQIVDSSELLVDFAMTAALMKEMDVVISVCTSTANLAGAIGCDTRVLLQKHADWRWANDKLWFPAITTYRQSVRNVWTDVLDRVLKDLAGAARSVANGTAEGAPTSPPRPN
jgi:Tfp pilus assembly protein PilF